MVFRGSAAVELDRLEELAFVFVDEFVLCIESVEVGLGIAQRVFPFEELVIHATAVAVVQHFEGFIYVSESEFGLAAVLELALRVPQFD